MFISFSSSGAKLWKVFSWAPDSTDRTTVHLSFIG